MLWFSAPTRLNNDLLNDGEILGKYVETINLAFKSILGNAISCNEYATDLFPEGNEKSFWKTCPKEFGISKEKWWSGGWVADLICYRTMRAMRWIMKWDLRTTETSEDFLVLVLPFEFKLENESVAFTLLIPISCKEIEIQSGKEVKHLEENDDEEKFRMVVKRMANAIRMSPKLSRKVGTATRRRKMERHLQRIVGFGSMVKDKKTTRLAVIRRGRPQPPTRKSCPSSNSISSCGPATSSRE